MHFLERGRSRRRGSLADAPGLEAPRPRLARRPPAQPATRARFSHQSSNRNPHNHRRRQLFAVWPTVSSPTTTSPCSPQIKEIVTLQLQSGNHHHHTTITAHTTRQTQSTLPHDMTLPRTAIIPRAAAPTPPPAEARQTPPLWRAEGHQMGTSWMTSLRGWTSTMMAGREWAVGGGRSVVS